VRQYLDLITDIIDNGNDSDDRTGTGTLSLFAKRIEFDLNDGFPLLTVKHTPFKLIASELLWFLSGSTNNEELRQLNGNKKDTIWEEWSLDDGSLGPIYGNQWRNWNGIDQINNLVQGLRDKPSSRRHILSAWNVSDLPDESVSPKDNVRNGKMALAPCHAFLQFYARKLTYIERCNYWFNNMDNDDVPEYALSCHLYQRSCDVFLGLGFNIASYALFTHMLSNVLNMIPEKLVISFGDVHLYKNHLDQANMVLEREPYQLPVLVIDKKYESIDDFTMDSFKIVNYKHHARISAEVSV